MAKVVKTDEDKKHFREALSRLLQSGNINFILGSGASYPAIAVAGNVESEIQTALEEGEINEAEGKIYDLIKGVKAPFTGAENDNTKATTKNYQDFIGKVESILIERKSSLIPKQANIFTTNYDLFLEKASEFYPAIIFSDGFVRTPNIRTEYEFSSRSFFNATYNKGNLYNYKVEVPTINFIKIHGSLSWKKVEDIFGTEEDKILFNPISNFPKANATTAEQKQEFNEQFAVVLPRKDKFRETIMDRTYYDLLRIYANELDKENTLLVAFGFSFQDEHIRDITIRALKNPTLRLVVFAYDNSAEKSLTKLFNGYSNVDIYSAEGNGAKIDYAAFINVLEETLNPPEEESEDEDEDL
ncbi:MAG: SIR2 family protein [Bdellovibrionales bacterium]|nr:SIR2 family protein [Bdellovibrionales bacterium]